MSEQVADRLMPDSAVPQAGRAPSRARRPSLRLLAATAVAALVLVGIGRYAYHWWTVGRFTESTDDAYVGGDVTAIAPRVAGFIEAVLVTDNQRVDAGQTLIVLDKRDFAAALTHAEAVLQGQQAALANLRARRTLQTSVIDGAAADLAARRAQAEFTAQDDQRYHALALTAAGSRQSAEKALADNRSAQAAVASALASLQAANQQIAVLDTQIAEATAHVAQAEADLQTARLNLGYTVITAPVAGYVGNRSAQVGAYIPAGTNLLSIVPASGLWVDANFKEDQIAQMRPGDKATVVADVRSERLFHGRIVSLAPATGAVFSIIPPQNATGNFTKIVQRVPIRVALDDDGAELGLLRPGLSTNVSVDIGARPE